MGTWNNRIIRYRKRDAGLGLHAVHYDEKGRAWGMTQDAVTFTGDNADDLKLSLALAIADAHRLPVLSEPRRWPGTPPGEKRKRATPLAKARE